MQIERYITNIFLLLSRLDGYNACTTVDGTPCVFPFIYQGREYSDCTNATDSTGQLWCATKVDENQFYITKSNQWGYCSEECFNIDFQIDTRTVEEGLYEADRQCGNSAICTHQSQCPKFLEEKANLNKLAKNSQTYRETLSRIRDNVCNRAEKGVCCEGDPRCGVGVLCLNENKCEYTKDLQRKFKRGDNNARTELRKLICDRKERKFCCPKIKVNIEPNTDGFPNIGTGKFPGKSASWLPEHGECGLNPNGTVSRVLGGEDTTPGMFPFTALLGYPVRENKWNNIKKKFEIQDNTKYKCGGTLINHWYVLTAGHCQGKRKRDQISVVRLGEWEVARNKDCTTDGFCLNPVQDFEITPDLVTVHENHKKVLGNVLNDIALVKLPRPAVLNSGVQIVCLPLKTPNTARQLNIPDLREGLINTVPVVVGWGYQEYDPWAIEQQGDFKEANVASKVQQKLGVPIISSSECAQKFKAFEPESTQICAGGQQGKDSCRGDSGGPLYLAKVGSNGIPTLDGSEPLYLIGIVSFGSKTCGIGKPGIYTRVADFIPWIRQHIGNM